ncbi:DUF4974 domain-containing protein [Segetibacter sp. 3557_3]|uniref:FecR family protein n=1 Tax=Segetibacter sp. 3557_3 TaxID=2547429 RepID=UPI00105906D3|nr:FecR domain-containing protein [Segetibacter sp. 3557_3]TDH29049.1 DUF4974 domain-containing protein [Segetibacter sp. 3557_3]
MSEDIHDTIDDLLVKVMLGEASPGEETTVRDWIAASSENNRYYQQFRQIWQQSRILGPENAPGEEEAWQKLQLRIQPPAGAKVVTFSRYRGVAIAAAVILVAATFIVSLLVYDGTPKESRLVSTNAVIHDTLPDGSIITLNKNSSLTFPARFNDDQRLVSLQGEAFFNVSPDPGRPFIITTDEATVRVTGTSFNVNSREAVTTVIVESGTVVVSNPKQAITLKPKQKVSIAKKDTTARVQMQTNVLYNYYRTRQFVCRNTPLMELTEKLSLAYNVQFRFGREQIKDLRLTTTFNDQSLETILNIVSATFGITWVQTGDTILLK